MDLVVEQVEAEVRFRLRLEIELPLEAPDLFRCFQAHRQSPLLFSFKSTPEVRVLSSAGITRHQRSYDPVRLPPGPSPNVTSRARPSPHDGYPPITHITLLACRDQLPRWTETGAFIGYFPIPRGLPLISGGSASTTSLSRPARTSLTLPPASSLNRPRRPLSQGFAPAGYPTKPPASYQIKPTTIRVEPSSTGDTRRRGALRSPG